ncbi:putative integrase [Shimwellia blattae DSM 4481 = NBRC 105725]|uniref:Putative integrase n=1 Tax=Shimwellia blattae (strain ATCC 29907 / DSM 4481 / JCM 1650 / NBRC 105725 / CDC 9005-74) TaxID=630626 RepID=I2B3R1_SHIBC|nr:putative integrase [Shimwellia blattae DSM 4481 = NBRC 105725]AFJ48001.1 putative integrase [Shimwellia blattae DSM 4481 = NBRC 105725]GAB82839.1 putative transposase [Shimwellia blattae DSM 4481 = NBRC 105725]
MPRSTYYYQCARSDTTTDKYADIVLAIQAIYKHHAGRYGYRRMTLALRKEGFTLNHKTVRKLMKEHGLLCQLRRKKYRSYMGGCSVTAENLLARNFRACSSGLKWCTDITEFRAGTHKLYLSVIQDLFNKEIVAWHTSLRPSLGLVCKTLDKSLKGKNYRPELILHSDQGWHYHTLMWRSMLADAGIRPSMSRKGNCLDNAVMENFFSHLKTEMYYRKEYRDPEELRRDIAKYIHYFNQERISLKTGGVSPVEYRAQVEKQ